MLYQSCVFAVLIRSTRGAQEAVTGPPHETTGCSSSGSGSESKDLDPGEIVPDLVKICSNKGIELRLGISGALRNCKLSGKSPGFFQIQTYGQFIKDEIDLYPKQFYEKLGLKYIHIASELSIDGGARYAIPVPEAWHVNPVDGAHTRMYLDPRLPPLGGMEYLASLFHHEIHHHVDYCRTGTFEPKDKEWDALNHSIPYAIARDDDTYYKTQTTHQQRLTYQHGAGEGNTKTKRGRTFITTYAGSRSEEDRAEIFKYLVFDPSRCTKYSLSDETEGSPIWKKMELMKARIFGFCSEMDETFWGLCAQRAVARKKSLAHHVW